MSDGAAENLQTDSVEEEASVSVTIESCPTFNASAENESPEAMMENGGSSPDMTTSTSPTAKALSSLISSIIRDSDSQAEATLRSQDQLSFAIDRLTRELDQLLEDAPSPFIMQHAAKISGVRKRVSSLNSVLKSIQRRIDRIDRLMSAGLPNVMDSDDVEIGEVIICDVQPDDKVVVILGRGSSFDAVYVGKGMLTAAAIWNRLFDHPPVESILRVIGDVTRDMACLPIVKDYADHRHFREACKKAKG